MVTKVDVVIEGTTPILLHNPAGMGKSSAGKPAIPSPEEEAEASCYWLDASKSALAYPGDNIKASMLVAAPMYKSGKLRLAPLVAGSVYIEPSLISFGIKTYEIDTRRAVVQRQGILRSRARLSKWQLKFVVVVDEDWPGPSDVLKSMLEEAGRRVGIGDFRPAKKGWFGKFKVVQWVPRNGKEGVGLSSGVVGSGLVRSGGVWRGLVR